jgi:hypothetical protein
VCRNKDDESLFITTRASREAMVSAFKLVGQVVDSNVLKSFPTYAEAMKYKVNIEDVNKKIDKL